MSSNTKISNLISSQVPFFVRNDHPNFIAFLEAYYEWLEQNDETLDVIKNIKDYFDVDQSVGVFTEELYKTFIEAIPTEAITDKAVLVKNIKDFYRARGTEKSVVFLLRILFGEEASNTIFYYPKRDILRVSDGKWYVEKSLRVNDIKLDGTDLSDNERIKTLFKNTKIKGNSSTATALVERVDVYYDGQTLIREIKISNQYKHFQSNETIFTLYDDEDGNTHSLTANTFSGMINKVTLLEEGTGYTAGSVIPVESVSGSGAIIKIASVSPGNVKSIYVTDGGAGYRANQYLLFAGGSGTGANAKVSSVTLTEQYHPNSYNIVYSIINLEANTPINNTVYSNLNSGLSDPCNSAISNSVSSFVYANTGPVAAVVVITGGNNYITPPTASVIANTRIRELGILGKMVIANGGTGYAVSDKIVFTNIPGGYGTGASGNVTNVAVGGTITEIKFETVPGFPPGGLGFDQDYLPLANVISSGGSGANIQVTAVLGFGANLTPVSDKLGAIQSITIVSGGTGYETAPTLNLQSLGDGTAQATATIVTGAYTYPGRYLNDDGQPSGYNFIQDRDYYQNFSYVVKIGRSINEYRKYLKDLLHPAGLKLFGEYTVKDEIVTANTEMHTVNTSNLTLVYATYVARGRSNGTMIEVTTERTVTGITNAYVEFVDGNAISSIANGLYSVTTNSTSSFIFVNGNSSIKVNGSGNIYTTVI